MAQPLPQAVISALSRRCRGEDVRNLSCRGLDFFRRRDTFRPRPPEPPFPTGLRRKNTLREIRSGTIDYLDETWSVADSSDTGEKPSFAQRFSERLKVASPGAWDALAPHCVDHCDSFECVYRPQVDQVVLRVTNIHTFAVPGALARGGRPVSLAWRQASGRRGVPAPPEDRSDASGDQCEKVVPVLPEEPFRPVAMISTLNARIHAVNSNSLKPGPRLVSVLVPSRSAR